MFDLTALMIVCNGAERIAKAINSIAWVTKQIIVIDTGSVDNSPVIASQLGAEVHFFEWQNDFALARNYGLQFARYPWILIIDSDEELNQQSLVENFNLTSDPKVGGLRVQIVNHVERGNSYTKTHHTYTRIFRNHPAIRFEAPIHEQIAQSILDAGFQIVDTNITIDHYGYSSINIDKINRNRELLENALKDNPDDHWTIFHLAETEFAIGNIDKARLLYEKILDSFLLNPEQTEMVRIRLAQIALKTDKYAQVYEYLPNPCTDKHREGLRLMIIATALLMEQRFAEAEEVFNRQEIQLSDMVDKTQIQKAIELINFLSKRG
jgi:glycosyltransferase involved in cell wall biosynthesis